MIIIYIRELLLYMKNGFIIEMNSTKTFQNDEILLQEKEFTNL